MGGCRCFFRDCKVNSYKQPLMHFFRFPMKDKERFRLWREYSQQQHILEYSTSKQRNCIVCARHFRDECFMNYKKDRLKATAVPTIHRLSKDKALDFEKDMENGVLVTLPEPQEEYLIPPPEFECPLGLDVDELLWIKLKNIERHSDGNNPEELVRPANSFVTNRMEGISSSSDNIQIVEVMSESTQASRKRKRSSLPTRETPARIYSANKRIKTLNHTQQIMTAPILAEHILPHGTTIVLDDIDNSNPTIINHQIPENDGNVRIGQESYSISDNGADYEFVEIQSNEAQNVLPSDDESKKSDVCLETEVTPEQWQANYLEMESAYAELVEEKKALERKLTVCRKENNRSGNNVNVLQSEVAKLKEENEALKKQLQNTRQISENTESGLWKKYEQQLQSEQFKHSRIEKKLQQQIATLEHNLGLVKQQLADAKSNQSSTNVVNVNAQTEKMNLIKQQLETEHKMQNLQEMYDNIVVQHGILEKNHEILQKTNKKLKEDYTKLESLQNQVSTVTTSNNNSAQANATTASPVIVGSLTKAQLFNGIKRYISSSMVALLRMEMFGSSEREWKPDERKVAVDLLRLGESVYKYFADEWRFRLPGLRDVHNWLTQAAYQEDEEEDL